MEGYQEYCNRISYREAELLRPPPSSPSCYPLLLPRSRSAPLQLVSEVSRPGDDVPPTALQHQAGAQDVWPHMGLWPTAPPGWSPLVPLYRLAPRLLAPIRPPTQVQEGPNPLLTHHRRPRQRPTAGACLAPQWSRAGARLSPRLSDARIHLGSGVG